MKRACYLFIIIEIIFSESSNKIFEIKNHNITSVWLSRFPALNTNGAKRLVFQYGRSIAITNNRNYISYPNIDFGLKAMKNLSVTAKLNGVSLDNEFFHVIGSGVQYFYGGEDTLNWVSCIQRVDLKGGKDFKLSTVTMDIRKLINFNFFQFRIGIGSNFYKKTSFDNIAAQFTTKKEQINFIGLDAIIFHHILNFGIDIYIAPYDILGSLFIQKEFL